MICLSCNHIHIHLRLLCSLCSKHCAMCFTQSSITIKPGFVKFQVLPTSLLYLALLDFHLPWDFICHPFLPTSVLLAFYPNAKQLRFDQYCRKSMICLLIPNSTTMWSTKSSSVVIDLSLLSFNSMHRAEILV